MQISNSKCKEDKGNFFTNNLIMSFLYVIIRKLLIDSRERKLKKILICK